MTANAVFLLYYAKICYNHSMKKILIILYLLYFPVFALQVYTINTEYSDFMDSLKLSKKQKIKIEQIEKDYNKRLVETRAQIALKDMEIAKLRNRNCPSEVYMLNSQIRQMQKDYNELYEQKEEEIETALNFFQRRKYKKYIKSKKIDPVY